MMDAYRMSERYAKLGIIFGVIGIAIWAFSLVSLIINILCIHYSIIGLESRLRELSFAALILGIIGILLTLFRGIVVL